MHKGYAFVQFTNPFDARNACHGEDGRTVLSQVLGKLKSRSLLYDLIKEIISHVCKIILKIRKTKQKTTKIRFENFSTDFCFIFVFLRLTRLKLSHDCVSDRIVPVTDLSQ